MKLIRETAELSNMCYIQQHLLLFKMIRFSEFPFTQHYKVRFWMNGIKKAGV